MASPLDDTKHQLMLGDESFIAQHQHLGPPDFLPEIARAQRRPLALSLNDYQEKFTDRDEAMAQAYLSTAFTMGQIGKHFGVAYRTVSRAVKTFESAKTY